MTGTGSTEGGTGASEIDDRGGSVRRRGLVRSLAAVATLGLAGCSSATDSFWTPAEEAHGEGDHDGGHDASDGGSELRLGSLPSEPAEHIHVSMVSEDGRFRFDPPVAWVALGGTITWKVENGDHTTSAYHPDNDRPLRIPDGAAVWDSEDLGDDGTTYEYTCDTEGVFDYFCNHRETDGMVGSIVVGEPDPHDQPGLAPPQDDLPEAARHAIDVLNEGATKLLGHGH